MYGRSIMKIKTLAVRKNRSYRAVKALSGAVLIKNDPWEARIYVEACFGKNMYPQTEQEKNRAGDMCG